MRHSTRKGLSRVWSGPSTSCNPSCLVGGRFITFRDSQYCLCEFSATIIRSRHLATPREGIGGVAGRHPPPCAACAAGCSVRRRRRRPPRLLPTALAARAAVAVVAASACRGRVRPLPLPVAEAPAFRRRGRLARTPTACPGCLRRPPAAAACRLPRPPAADACRLPRPPSAAAFRLLRPPAAAAFRGRLSRPRALQRPLPSAVAPVGTTAAVANAVVRFFRRRVRVCGCIRRRSRCRRRGRRARPLPYAVPSAIAASAAA